MPRTILPVRIGQVWASPKTGHRFQIVGQGSLSYIALDLDASHANPRPARVGDNHFSFTESDFRNGVLEFDHADGVWTRSDLETLKGWERPRVRARYGDWGEKRCQDFWAEIVPDTNPWIVFYPSGLGGRSQAFQVSWDLLLEVLNNPHAQPIFVEEKHCEPYRT